MLLGNDVVDLQWSPKHGDAYFERLKSYAFSTSELLLLSKSCESKELRLLWSVKESCYKSAVKKGYLSRFMPKAFVIDSLEKSESIVCCTVSHNSGHYQSKSLTKSCHIHTTALPAQADFSQVFAGSELIESTNYIDQTRQVRDLASQHLSSCCSGTISFDKDERGVPFVNIDDQRMNIDISFSHDENVAGFAVIK